MHLFTVTVEMGLGEESHRLWPESLFLSYLGIVSQGPSRCISPSNEAKSATQVDNQVAPPPQVDPTHAFCCSSTVGATARPSYPPLVAMMLGIMRPATGDHPGMRIMSCASLATRSAGDSASKSTGVECEYAILL